MGWFPSSTFSFEVIQAPECTGGRIMVTIHTISEDLNNPTITFIPSANVGDQHVFYITHLVYPGLLCYSK